MKKITPVLAIVLAGIWMTFSLHGCSTAHNERGAGGGYFIDGRSGQEKGVFNDDRAELKGDFSNEPADHRGPFTDEAGVKEEWGQGR